MCLNVLSGNGKAAHSVSLYNDRHEMMLHNSVNDEDEKAFYDPQFKSNHRLIESKTSIFG